MLLLWTSKKPVQEHALTIALPFAREATVILLRVPGRLEYRELALRVVATACKLLRHPDGTSLDEEYTHEAVSAIGEAFNNVVLHGYKSITPNDIIFEITTLEDRLVIDVKDFGTSFHPDDAPEPDLGTLPESGMGLFIIRAFVDELTYEAGSPNCLRMVKRFGNDSHTRSQTD